MFIVDGSSREKIVWFGKVLMEVHDNRHEYSTYTFDHEASPIQYSFGYCSNNCCLPSSTLVPVVRVVLAIAVVRLVVLVVL